MIVTIGFHSYDDPDKMMVAADHLGNSQYIYSEGEISWLRTMRDLHRPAGGRKQALGSLTGGSGLRYMVPGKLREV